MGGCSSKVESSWIQVYLKAEEKKLYPTLKKGGKIPSPGLPTSLKKNGGRAVWDAECKKKGGRLNG